MAEKTIQQLAAQSTLQDTDLLVIQRGSSPLAKIGASVLATYVAGFVTGALKAANNLSDLVSAATARTNLGLGTAATMASGAFAQVANNLSDLASAATARTNLGLGNAATRNVGTVAGTVAAGDDARINGAFQSAAGGLIGGHTEVNARLDMQNGNGLFYFDAADDGTPVYVFNDGTGLSVFRFGGAQLLQVTEAGTTSAGPLKAPSAVLGGLTGVRVAAGAAANSGRISWGTGAPPALAVGEIYLQVPAT